MVISPSDGIKDEAQRKLWGDHWVKHELERAFGALGIEVVDRSPGCAPVPLRDAREGAARGCPQYGLGVQPCGQDHPPDACGIRPYLLPLAFLHPHPARHGVPEHRTHDRRHPPRCRYGSRTGTTSCFVGNSRGPGGRPVIDAIGDVPYRFKVWGDGWDQVLPERYLGGLYHDYESLDELYASSLISINDHHPDMAREGFRRGEGVRYPRKRRVRRLGPQQGHRRDLREIRCPSTGRPGTCGICSTFYLSHPHEREELMRKGRAIALSHTWRRRAEQCVNGFMPALAGRAARRSAGPPRSVDRAGARGSLAQGALCGYLERRPQPRAT